MPSSTMAPVLMPCARAMRVLEPVARIARPRSVEKNQSVMNLQPTTITSSSAGRHQKSSMPAGCSWLNTVGSLMSGMLGPPMMRRLTENSAIIIRIEASRSMIFSRTFSQPVIKPATAPASVPAMVAV